MHEMTMKCIFIVFERFEFDTERVAIVNHEKTRVPLIVPEHNERYEESEMKRTKLTLKWRRYQYSCSSERQRNEIGSDPIYSLCGRCRSDKAAISARSALGTS